MEYGFEKLHETHSSCSFLSRFFWGASQVWHSKFSH